MEQNSIVWVGLGLQIQFELAFRDLMDKSAGFSTKKVISLDV